MKVPSSDQLLQAHCLEAGPKRPKGSERTSAGQVNTFFFFLDQVIDILIFQFLGSQGQFHLIDDKAVRFCLRIALVAQQAKAHSSRNAQMDKMFRCQ